MTPRGFTVIESLVVVALLLIVMAASSPILSGSLNTRSIGNYASDAVDAIREAQAATMNGRNDARHGVHFDGTKLVFFSGATYSAGAALNDVHTFANGVSITAVSLSPGGACTLPAGTGNCDVHFASRRGTPTETGTITLSETGGTTRTVTVNEAGMVDAN